MRRRSTAGVLQACYNGYIAPQMFHWSVSGFALIMSIVVLTVMPGGKCKRGLPRSPPAYSNESDVAKRRPFLLKAAVNRRGDALVVWGAKTEQVQLWARYKPIGQKWTRPVLLTASALRGFHPSRPSVFT